MVRRESAEMGLPPRYAPAEIEGKWYLFWNKKGLFRSVPKRRKKPFTIVIPPPNVTGVLHMGHALNVTLQDVITRFRRMQGYNALWLPGTDHAGIATQNVVERELAKEGLRKEDLGREAFLGRIWDWKEKHGGRIIAQLKRLGASCDWTRERFTMDEGLSRAVRAAFVKLFDAGFIYRGEYLVNWCPRCGTALSDDEVEHVEEKGKLWYIRYPLKGEKRSFVTVATTRPETMLGDTAVAVHPSDERYKGLVGKTCVLPLVGRDIPVITDENVSSSFGTGAVKVTPAHDPDDFRIGQRHSLESVNIMNKDATMNENAGAFQGLDRTRARQRVVEELEKKDLLEKVEDHLHSVGHCYRCHTVVEPRLSLQWFVKMRPLAERAIEATKTGRVVFHPERWTKVYLQWLDQVRDWCISRQIWWGHRIPVWYCRDCEKIVSAVDTPDRCPQCLSHDLVQDPDVLDTWFSSALWPFSTLGWPDETADLEYYYPTDALITDRGIIYFWVARMVMMGSYILHNVPFRHVYIHGTILDESGRKMSKSLGNGIDPIEMIEQYGADAVRCSLILLSSEGQDVRLAPTKFELGRNFANKVWNASRFVLAKLEEAGGPPGRDLVERDDLTFVDRWILSRLHDTIARATSSFERYRYNEAVRSVYEFIWHDYCDWYLELAKKRLKEKDAAALRVLTNVLDNCLRLLHPLAPFLTEEAWQELGKLAPSRELFVKGKKAAESIMVAPWPEHDPELIDHDAESRMKALQEIAVAVRDLRARKGAQPQEKVEAVVSILSEEDLERLKGRMDVVEQMARASVEVGLRLDRPEGSAAKVLSFAEVYLPLGRDIERERERVEKELEKLDGLLASVETRLRNADFLEKAPKKVVEQTRTRRADLLSRIERLKEHLEAL